MSVQQHSSEERVDVLVQFVLVFFKDDLLVFPYDLQILERNYISDHVFEGLLFTVLENAADEDRVVVDLVREHLDDGVLAKHVFAHFYRVA